MPKIPDVVVKDIEQVIDGKAYYYRLDKEGKATEVSVCCDCDLVHVMEFKPLKRKLRVRVWRDDERTNSLRSKKRAKPLDKKRYKG